MADVKQAIKRALQRVAPGLAGPVLRFTQGRHVAGVERRLGVPGVNAKVAGLTGGRVAGGPFAGMAYVGGATGSQYSPKLVGAYETEIHPWVERAVGAGYDLFVDVGCAEGYYAVGFALRSPGTRVLAYDTHPLARRLTAELAARNGVAGRVDVRAECRPATFAGLPPGRLLVLCDCEGYEAVLLDPAAAPRLRSADVLVELHEQPSPGVTDLLAGRFAGTHRVERVSVTDRDAEAYPVLASLDVADRRLAVNELRGGPQTWLMLTATGG